METTTNSLIALMIVLQNTPSAMKETMPTFKLVLRVELDLISITSAERVLLVMHPALAPHWKLIIFALENQLATTKMRMLFNALHIMNVPINLARKENVLKMLNTSILQVDHAKPPILQVKVAKVQQTHVLANLMDTIPLIIVMEGDIVSMKQISIRKLVPTIKNSM